MANTGNEHVVVGKFGASFGVKGWLKVVSYTEYGPDIVEYKPWHVLNTHGDWDAIIIEETKLQQDRVIAKIKGVNTPEEAKLFTGKTIAIFRTQLPTLPTNEYYWSDLEGLQVVNVAGEQLGTVLYLMATGSNDVLVVKTANNVEHAIPYLLGTVIKKVDLEKKQILVDWEVI